MCAEEAACGQGAGALTIGRTSVHSNRHAWMRQGPHSPGVCAELQLSISPLRLGVEIYMHAGRIAFTQIEDTADDIDARTAFAIFNSHVLYLMPCKRFQA